MITDATIERALEAANGAMVDTRRHWTEGDRAAVRAMLEAAQSEMRRSITVPPEVIEAAEWYAGVPARVGKMSDFILKLAKDKA